MSNIPGAVTNESLAVVPAFKDLSSPLEGQFDVQVADGKLLVGTNATRGADKHEVADGTVLAVGGAAVVE